MPEREEAERVSTSPAIPGKGQETIEAQFKEELSNRILQEAMLSPVPTGWPS